MAPEGTEVSRAANRATAHAVGASLRETIPPPTRTLGEDQVRTAYHVDDERRLHAFAPHLRRLFDSMSEDDAGKLQAFMNMRPETINWISGKSDKELKNLDGTVEFISSSRTAGKVLFYVGSVCAAALGTAFTLAKSGYDLFAAFRGIK